MAADPLTSTTVDDLLNFDSTDDGDPFNDKPPRQVTRDDKTTLSPRPTKRKAADLDDTLGLDSEVKVKKQRKPVAKLDEARLLSAPGIPKLRADARLPNFLAKKLRIKGKGHEFSDVARLLSYYQLWLDDLYPRAKFADGLQLIEKAGHSRRMQVMRKEWIDEGKPGYIREREARKAAKGMEEEMDDAYSGDAIMSGANNEPSRPLPVIEEDTLFVPDSRNGDDKEQDESGLPEDDELEALLAEQDNAAETRPMLTQKTIVDDDSEGEDDLDALLAEQENRPISSILSTSAAVSKPKISSLAQDEDEDMDDLDELLAEQETRSKRITSDDLTQTQASAAHSKAPVALDEDDFPVEDDDELDAFLAETEGHEKRQNAEPELPAFSTKIESPSLFVEDEDLVDADGADMFSSSPVQRTAQPSWSPGRDDGPDPNAVLQSISTVERYMETKSSRTDGPEAAQCRKEEDLQGMDAQDMFSSSPLQKE